MAALSANKKRHVRNVGAMQKGALTGASSTTFYEGGAICAGSGLAQNGADTSGYRTLGVGVKEVTTGASNTVKIEFEFGHEEWFAQDGNIAAANLGGNAVWLDNATLTNAATATNDVEAGRVVELETIDGQSGAWIQVAVFGVDNI